MNKASSILLIIIVSAFLLKCGSKQESSSGWDVTISGKVGFPKEGNITLKSWSDTTDGFEIVDLDKGNYTFKKVVHITEPGYWRLNFYESQYVDIALYKNDLEINVDGDKPSGFVEVIGSPDIELFKKIQSIRQSFNDSPELNRLSEQFNVAVQNKDEKLIGELQLKYREMLKAPNDSIARLLVLSSPSIGAIEYLSKNELDPDQYFSIYEEVAEKLKEEWSNYEIGKTFIENVTMMKRVAIGEVAPEISLPNPEGVIVPLSSLKGKYVLVDFWAKWCGPCRQENPNVVRVYNKFKDKGFEVYGVSLDMNKSDWTQAIAEDGLTWTHVSDLKYFNSEAAQTYNISAIPFSILLDPEGKIIAKNLRGGALEKKLSEVFKAL